jgi:V/A-type H+/Na+-transporting ATPase subunit E
MSGEALKQEIRKGAEEKAKLTVADAKSKAEQILAEAEGEAKRVLDSRMRDAHRHLEQVERSEAAKARMECTRRILGIQAQYVEQVFKEAEARLSGLSVGGPAQYQHALTDFITEGSRALGGAALVAVVRDADREIVEGIARSSGASISTEPLESIGGVVIRTKDERSYFVNTFESRLLRAREELRAKVTDTLLGRA